MPKCNSHMKGETPRFLKPNVCDECEQIRLYRKVQTTRRKAAATRANRATAQLNGKPASAVVRSFHASKLPKKDPWYRPRARKAAK